MTPPTASPPAPAQPHPVQPEPVQPEPTAPPAAPHSRNAARGDLGDALILGAAAVTVLALAGVAGAISYRHALEVVRAHGEAGMTAFLSPTTIDGLVLVAVLVSHAAARRGQPTPHLAYGALVLGIGATLGVNVLHGVTYGTLGAAIAGWPAIAFIIAVHLFFGLIRHRHQPPPATGTPSAVPGVPGRQSGPVPAVPGPVPAPPPAQTPGVALPAVPVRERVTGTPVPAVPGPTGTAGTPSTATTGTAVLDDREMPEYLARAQEIFAAELAAGHLPSFREVKTRVRVGQRKANKVLAYLKAISSAPAGAHPEGRPRP